MSVDRELVAPFFVLPNGAVVGAASYYTPELRHFVTVDGRAVGAPLGSRRAAEVVARYLAGNLAELNAEVGRR